MNSYSETRALRACDCDMNAAWRPGAVLETLQEAAGADCARLGLPRAATDAMGIVWVVSRYRVEFVRAPRFGERVTVETFAMPARHLFYPRMYRFFDAAGEAIGGAYSLWLLMDRETRRAVNSEAVQARLTDNAGERPPVAAPGVVRPPEGATVRAELMPQYCDFDLNGHVNNTRCLEWCCNALGAEALEARYVQAFDVNYDAEIRPGRALRTELTRDGERFAFCGFDGDRRCFAVGGTLALR